MAEFFERLDFDFESLAKAFFIAERRVQDLDGCCLAGRRIHRFVDGPHPAPAKAFPDAIRSKLFGGHERGVVK
jgi:hypothetical protein